jgi:tRNA-2-methylthio-N6-dimethylallyladenosine synthase
MEDNISLAEKEERLQELNNLVNKYAHLSNEKMLNKIVPVLIEGYSDKPGVLMGYTDTSKLVNVIGDEKHIGKIVNVEITDIKSWSLNGRIINED